MLLSCPLAIGGNHILVIFAQNMHQKHFFQVPNAKMSCPGKGDTRTPPPPPPRPSPRSVASLPRSAPRRSAHWTGNFNPPPRKFSGYGPVDSIQGWPKKNATTLIRNFNDILD